MNAGDAWHAVQPVCTHLSGIAQSMVMYINGGQFEEVPYFHVPSFQTAFPAGVWLPVPLVPPSVVAKTRWMVI